MHRSLGRPIAISTFVPILLFRCIFFLFREYQITREWNFMRNKTKPTRGRRAKIAIIGHGVEWNAIKMNYKRYYNCILVYKRVQCPVSSLCDLWSKMAWKRKMEKNSSNILFSVPFFLVFGIDFLSHSHPQMVWWNLVNVLNRFVQLYYVLSLFPYIYFNFFFFMLLYHSVELFGVQCFFVVLVACPLLMIVYRCIIFV